MARLAWLPVVSLLLACAVPTMAVVKVDPDNLTPNIIDARPVQDRSPLPDYVHAPEGELTAYADWEHAKRTGGDGAQGVLDESDARMHVPLYLINRTERSYIVSQQDWYAYFMLEVEVDGQWRRAQPFFFSWCGNSYFNELLGPGQHLSLTGDIAADGPAEASARFRRVYEADAPIYTNVGVAKYDPKAILEASRDDHAIECELDGETLYELALTAVTEEQPSGDIVDVLIASHPDYALRLLDHPTVADHPRVHDGLQRELAWKGVLPADRLLALADDPDEASELNVAALHGLGVRHPEKARVLAVRRLEEQHPRAQETLAAVVSGVTDSPRLELDALRWAVRMEWDHDITYEPQIFSYAWGYPSTRFATQYPHAAIQWVQQQAQNNPDNAQWAKLQSIEYTVIESPLMPNDWRVEIMRGSVDFVSLDQGGACWPAGFYLVDHAPALVEPFIPGLASSPKTWLQELGQALREALAHTNETENE